MLIYVVLISISVILDANIRCCYMLRDNNLMTRDNTLLGVDVIRYTDAGFVHRYPKVNTFPQTLYMYTGLRVKFEPFLIILVLILFMCHDSDFVSFIY